MVEGDYFDKLEVVAKAVRRSKEPFGGIQLVLCGDFPITTSYVKGQREKELLFPGYREKRT